MYQNVRVGVYEYLVNLFNSTEKRIVYYRPYSRLFQAIHKRHQSLVLPAIAVYDTAISESELATPFAMVRGMDYYKLDTEGNPVFGNLQGIYEKMSFTVDIVTALPEEALNIVSRLRFALATNPISYLFMNNPDGTIEKDYVLASEVSITNNSDLDSDAEEGALIRYSIDFSLDCTILQGNVTDNRWVLTIPLTFDVSDEEELIVVTETGYIRQ